MTKTTANTTERLEDSTVAVNECNEKHAEEKNAETYDSYQSIIISEEAYNQSTGETPTNNTHEQQVNNCNSEKKDMLRNQSAFQVGDHVYLWSFFAHSTPGVAFCHGIVLSICDDGKRVEIIDLDAMIRRKPNIRRYANIRFDSAGNPRLSAHEENRGTWKHVEYGAHWLRRSICFSGTCTIVHSDATGLVLSRLHFLIDQYQKEQDEKENTTEYGRLVDDEQKSVDTTDADVVICQSDENNHGSRNDGDENDEQDENFTSINIQNDSVKDASTSVDTTAEETGLPQYHVLKANSECVAVWIKTGVWATLQASSWLHTTAAGQVKSTTTLAVMASTTQVSVPASGVWGWMGFTTKVSLLSTHPLLLPALAGYGLLTVGGPVWVLRRCRGFWNKTTNRLTTQFWDSALEKPEEFCQSVTEWSAL